MSNTAINEAGSAVLTIASLLAKDAANAAIAQAPGNHQRNYSYSSIAKSSAQLTTIFPLISSKNISLQTASMVTKFIEQKACIFLQLALQSANKDNAADGIEYLRKFHQNLDNGVLSTAIRAGQNTAAYGMSVYDKYKNEAAAELYDKIYSWYQAYDARSNYFAESATIDDSDAYEFDATLEFNTADLNALMQKYAENASIEVYDTHLNPRSLNDFLISEGYDGKVLVKTRSILQEAKNNRQSINSITDATMLKDQDINKMNDAMPSLLQVKFYRKDDTSGQCTSFIIGVKSKIVPCSPVEILRRIANDNKDGKFFINLMRTITGELKASDLLFGLSRMDEDIKSIKNKGTQGETWELLKTRAGAAKEALRRGQQNNFSAITTVLISQQDAYTLFKEENIDITNGKIAKHFMDSYNLMGIIIADDAVESLKVLFDDGSLDFEEIAYRTLEREQKNGDYKKLINLIAGSR